MYDILELNKISRIAHTSATVLWCCCDAENAEVTELRPEVPGKAVVAIDIGGAWSDLRFRECPHAVAHCLDFFR